MTDTSLMNPSAEIIARPSPSYRAKWILMGVVTLGMALWFAYDGFIGWPRQNRLLQETKDNRKYESHTNTDIFLQKVLAITLIPIGLAALIWTFYTTRGEYRLADNTLHVPGHPPVPLSSIREIDKSRWERKGIAVVAYEDPESKTVARLKLDDYVYERRSTDSIVEQIELVANATEASTQGAMRAPGEEHREP